jgi:hypothetical protein
MDDYVKSILLMSSLVLRKIRLIKVSSNNVIPAKAGIQKILTSLDSRLRGSDELIIIRGSL